MKPDLRQSAEELLNATPEKPRRHVREARSVMNTEDDYNRILVIDDNGAIHDDFRKIRGHERDVLIEPSVNKEGV